MATYNLGRILPRFRGNWDPTVNYERMDVVYFEGSSYMSVTSNINKRPPENESDWILSAAKGEPGEPGKDGPTYKAGKGISIVNDVISATGSGGEGGETYFDGFGIEIDENTNNINAEVKADNDVPNGWNRIEFTGLPESIIDDWDDRDVYYYKGGVYYSAGIGKHYKLNGTSWDRVSWEGLNDFYGRDVYVDSKKKMIYLKGEQQAYYDESTERWLVMSTNIPNPQGRFIFQGTNGYSYYSENSDKVYKIKDGSKNNTWVEIYAGNESCPGNMVWYDETNTYFSQDIRHFYFDYDNDRWRTMTWQGLNSFSGADVWYQGKHTFCSNGANNYIRKGSNWSLTSGLGTNIFGASIIYDGEKIFHFTHGVAKELVIPEPFYVTRHGDKLATEAFVTKNGVVRNDEGYETYRFVEIANAGLPEGFDGTPFYYKGEVFATYNNYNYRYDFATKQFIKEGWDSNVTTVSLPPNVFWDGQMVYGGYTFDGENWQPLVSDEKPDGLEMLIGAKYGKLGSVHLSNGTTMWCKRGGTRYSSTGNKEAAPWLDYDGNFWSRGYMLDDEGRFIMESLRPDLNLITNQGNYVWTDINGIIRLDAPSLHKMLVGSGDDMRWVDAYYSPSSILPEKAVSTVAYAIGNKFYISYIDKYKTNRNDYLATEEFVCAKLGDIEELMKLI